MSFFTQYYFHLKSKTKFLHNIKFVLFGESKYFAKRANKLIVKLFIA